MKRVTAWIGAVDVQTLGEIGVTREGRVTRLLPWLIAGAWFAGTVVAFRFFELRLPKALWCVS